MNIQIRSKKKKGLKAKARPAAVASIPGLIVGGLPSAAPNKAEQEALALADKLAPVRPDLDGKIVVGGTLDQRRKAAKLRRDVEAAMRGRDEANAVRHGVRERLALEGARRGLAKPVVADAVPEAPGYVRVRNDDGLELVQLHPERDRGLRQAGFRYRDLYRSHAPKWRSQLDVREGRGSGSTDGLVWSALAMVKRGKVLTGAEARVAVLGEGHLKVLRAVAGDGQTLRQFAPSSRARDRATVQLKEALRALHTLFTTRP